MWGMATAPVTRLLVAANTATDIVQLAPPIASPFIWSATKAADGSISFAGFVPSQDVRLTLTDAVGKIGADTTAVASGEPDGFAARAVAALDLLADLDSGKVAFDGASWSVSGKVDSAGKASAASTAFAASALKDAGATYQVDAPTASAMRASADAATSSNSTALAATTTAAANASTPAPAATSTAAPAATTATAATPSAATAASSTAATAGYAWSAVKLDDGSVTFTGSVPDAGLKAFLARHIAGKLTDNSAIAANAPAAYLSDILLGLKAFSSLKSGKLAFAEGKWTLTGAGDDAAKASAKTDLALVDPKIWTVEVGAPAAITAAPATPPAPAATATAATAPATTTPPASTTAANPAPSSTAPAPAVANASPPASTPSATTTPSPTPAYSFAATKPASGPLSLTGDVPNEVVKDNLGSIAGGVSTDGLKIVANPPDNFINGAVGGLAALDKLASGQLNFDGGKWSLKGSAATPDGHDSIIASIGDLPGGKTWSLDIAGPPPLIVCRLKLADAAKAGNAVNFDVKTHFAKGTDAVLDSIATVLSACPDERVDVEGFTDADGNADANMALSVARAEAVVDALVKRGIKASRLYAVGYGETLPLVPNTTKGNKAKNRRIDFKVGDGPQ